MISAARKNTSLPSHCKDWLIGVPIRGNSWTGYTGGKKNHPLYQSTSLSFYCCCFSLLDVSYSSFAMGFEILNGFWRCHTSIIPSHTYIYNSQESALVMFLWQHSRVVWDLANPWGLEFPPYHWSQYTRACLLRGNQPLKIVRLGHPTTPYITKVIVLPHEHLANVPVALW